ncbi:MAG: ABC transporter substrate-binding protein [Chloroflexi bacterium]|nr:ABC transporter substrate-binding protein [Chloroflexota bacterium]
MKRVFSWLAFLTIAGLVLLACAPGGAQTKTPAGPPKAAAGEASRPGAATATPKAEASAPKYGGILPIALKLPTPHFDMISETGGMVQIPMAPAHNLLLKHDPLKDFAVAPDLAERWEVSSDGLTYLFHINRGVKFHNGRPLTAEDIKFNLERIASPPKGTLSVRMELYRNIERIETPDQLTLRIRLKQPQASFLTIAALPLNFISDPETIRQKGDMKRDVVGTGPFKMLDYVYGVSFSAVKNPDYFVKGRPYLDKVVFYTITDEITRSAALRTRQVLALPLFSSVSPSIVQNMKAAEPSLVVQKRVTPGPNSLIPNVKVAPWSDVRVRQAVNLAIDREAASKVVRQFHPGYGFVVPGSVWQLPQEELTTTPGYRQPKDQDIAEARRLLAEAGYARGFQSEFLSTSTIYTKETAEFASAQLAKLGIDLRIKILETAAWKKAAYDRTFNLGIIADASAIGDPDVLLGEYYLAGSPKNYGDWSSKRFDDLYASQSSALDPGKRKELVWELQRLLHKEAPRIIVVWTTVDAASQPEVKNWYQGSSLFLGNDLQDVWLSK